MADKKKQPDEGIIDLTELIESGAPAKSAAKNAYAQGVADPPADDDFESLLAGAENGDGRNAPASRPVDPNEQLDMSDMGDIDDLLESLDIPPQPQERPAPPPKAAPAPQPAASDDLDSVLDDLLGATPAASETPSDPPAEEEHAPQPMPDLDADLDNILASFDETAEKKPEAPAKPEAKETAPAEELNLDAELDGILAEMDTPKATPAPEPKPAKKQPAEDFELPADLDAMLDEAPAATETFTEPEPVTRGVREAVEEVEETAPMHLAPQPPMPVQAVQQDLIAGICHNIIAAQSAGTQDAMQEFSRQLGGQSAHLEDLSRNLTDLSKRLFACESKLGASRARMAAMEKSLAASTGIEDLIREGTPMHAGFMGLISSAVSTTLQGVASTLRPDDDLRQTLETMVERMKTGDALMHSLEARLAALEQAGSGDEMAGAKLAELAENEKTSLDRLAALEKRVDELALSAETGNLAAQLENLVSACEVHEQRMSAMDERMAAMEQSLPTDSGDHDARLASLAESERHSLERIENLEKRVAENEATLPGTDLAAKLDELANASTAMREQLLGFEQSMADTATAQDSRLTSMTSEIGNLDTRLSGIEQRLEDSAAMAASGSDAGEIEKMTGALATCEEKVGALSERFAALEHEVGDTVSGMKERIGELGDGAAGTMASLDNMEKRIASFETQALEADLPAELSGLMESSRASAEKLNSLESRMAEIEQAATNAGTGTDERLGALLAGEKAMLERMESLERKISQFEAASAEPEMAEAIKRLATGEKSAHARMDSLEKRLDDLEPNFNVQVEKAAATAVARILHEEIKKLAEG